MVSGGGGWGGPSKYSATSEIWTGTEWRLALGKLPYTARDVRMAFIDNRILYLGKKTLYSTQSSPYITYLLGGYDTKVKRKTILSFNLETEEWTKEGNMLEGRSAHGISVVDFDVYSEWCQHKLSGSGRTISRKLLKGLGQIVKSKYPCEILAPRIKPPFY